MSQKTQPLPTVIVDDLVEPPCRLCGDPLLAHELEHYINDHRVCRGCFARARAAQARPRSLMTRLVAVVTGTNPKIRLRRI